MTNSVRTNPVRQELVVAEIELDYTNLNASGEVTLFQLPANAVVVGGQCNVTTAFNAGTSLKLDIGDGTDADLWTATEIALEVAGVYALSTTTITAGRKMTSVLGVIGTLTLTSTAPTEGSCIINMEYYLHDRGCFAHGDKVETP